jgi:hypothetical protein
MSIHLLESPGRLDPGALVQECRRLVSYFEDFLRSTTGAPALRFPADAPSPPANPAGDAHPARGREAAIQAHSILFHLLNIAEDSMGRARAGASTSRR